MNDSHSQRAGRFRPLTFSPEYCQLEPSNRTAFTVVEKASKDLAIDNNN